MFCYNWWFWCPRVPDVRCSQSYHNMLSILAVKLEVLPKNCIQTPFKTLGSQTYMLVLKMRGLMHCFPVIIFHCSKIDMKILQSKVVLR